MKAAALVVALAAIACAPTTRSAAPRPATNAPATNVPEPKFVEVARADPTSKLFAPTLSACEAGGSLVCGRHAVLRVVGDRALRDELLERGLPHGESGEVAGTVAQIVGRFPEAAWLRLQRPSDDDGFCEDAYRFVDGAWERIGVPHCHSLAVQVGFVARRSDVLVVRELEHVEIVSPSGVLLARTEESCGFRGVAVGDDDAVLVAHGRCDGRPTLVESWSATFGARRSFVAPKDVLLTLGRDLWAYGARDRAPWLARFDEGRWTSVGVPGLPSSIDAWGRDDAGDEWAIVDEKVFRRHAGGTFQPIAIGPGTPKVLTVRPDGEVWIEVWHEHGARGLLRARMP